MKASVLDLRYKMKDILSALDKNEEVTILYHGKVKGVIVPATMKTKSKVEAHPFFGMKREDEEPVLVEMEKLMGGRYCEI